MSTRPRCCRQGMHFILYLVSSPWKISEWATEGQMLSPMNPPVRSSTFLSLFCGLFVWRFKRKEKLRMKIRLDAGCWMSGSEVPLLFFGYTNIDCWLFPESSPSPAARAPLCRLALCRFPPSHARAETRLTRCDVLHWSPKIIYFSLLQRFLQVPSQLTKVCSLEVFPCF